MSDKPLQVGDLVRVAKWLSCGCKLNWVFRIGGMVPRPMQPMMCSLCYYAETHRPEDAAFSDGGAFIGAPLSWLRRIPPLSELESTRTEETLKVPA